MAETAYMNVLEHWKANTKCKRGEDCPDCGLLSKILAIAVLNLPDPTEWHQSFKTKRPEASDRECEMVEDVTMTAAMFIAAGAIICRFAARDQTTDRESKNLTMRILLDAAKVGMRVAGIPFDFQQIEISVGAVPPPQGHA